MTPSLRTLAVLSLGAACAATALHAQRTETSAASSASEEFVVTAISSTDGTLGLVRADGTALSVPAAIVRARRWGTLLAPGEPPGIRGEIPPLQPGQAAVARLAFNPDGTVARAALVLCASRAEADQYLAGLRAPKKSDGTGIVAPAGAQPPGTPGGAPTRATQPPPGTRG